MIDEDYLESKVAVCLSPCSVLPLFPVAAISSSSHSFSSCTCIRTASFLMPDPDLVTGVDILYLPLVFLTIPIKGLHCGVAD